MIDSNCAMMELHCLERARSDPLNRGKWIAQAERWHELARAQNSWRRRSPFNSRCIRAQLLRKPNASNALDSQLRNLVTSLALELEPQGVRAGLVSCGCIEPGTPFSPERIAEEFFVISKDKPGSPNERQFRG